LATPWLAPGAALQQLAEVAPGAPNEKVVLQGNAETRERCSLSGQALTPSRKVTPRESDNDNYGVQSLSRDDFCELIIVVILPSAVASRHKLPPSQITSCKQTKMQGICRKGARMVNTGAMEFHSVPSIVQQASVYAAEGTCHKSTPDSKAPWLTLL